VVRARLAAASARRAAGKLIVAIGNYAYDWADGHPAERTFEEAVLTAKESEGNIHLETISLNPTFAYADDDDHVHHVWMLDVVTAFNQMKLVRAAHARGVALWRLGSEDPPLWKVFGEEGKLDADVARSLEEPQFGYELDYEGRGEILQLTARPQPGRREIQFDSKQQMIAAERFSVLPSPYVITRYGDQPRKIALTFDDGPDPDTTPQILDALRVAGVRATFFVTGANGEVNTPLLQREIAEGHEIGNHTFTRL
jgi:peptidoglycan-N-acetylglucosamine deacetylase